jgi:hypothetical protein
VAGSVGRKSTRDKRKEKREEGVLLSLSYFHASAVEAESSSSLAHSLASSVLCSTFPFAHEVQDDASDCSATRLGRWTPVKRGEKG